MNRTFRKQVTATGLFAIVLWTAGCGGSTNTASTSTDKGPLQIWTMEDSTSFTALMQDFTRQTGIPVQVEAVPWANVNGILSTSDAGTTWQRVAIPIFPAA